MKDETQTWHVYHIYPIDFGWEYLPEFEDVLCKISKYERRAAGGTWCIHTADFVADFARAKKLADAIGWEGDYRETPRILFFPVELEFKYGFAWKHDNNGDTFIISPFHLPWLEPVIVSSEVSK